MITSSSIAFEVSTSTTSTLSLKLIRWAHGGFFRQLRKGSSATAFNFRLAGITVFRVTGWHPCGPSGAKSSHPKSYGPLYFPFFVSLKALSRSPARMLRHRLVLQSLGSLVGQKPSCSITSKTACGASQDSATAYHMTDTRTPSYCATSCACVPSNITMRPLFSNAMASLRWKVLIFPTPVPGSSGQTSNSPPVKSPNDTAADGPAFPLSLCLAD